MNKHLRQQMEYCDADAHSVTKDAQFIASNGFQDNYYESQACKRVVNHMINLADELSWLIVQLLK